ncbi:DUF6193 family natural product biosynthesis protein [Streptomyces rhizosphaerihabitans]|uniref:DUF6193 family natural product biosynthesis protein n=1 Tax=Streptomyces rhizosphaerihabitans TaxID=1266770 RepID=UPI0021C0C660|nr:DUF6193 family natural product biosynthesis protein [Streptomyces rhizosphaerihabitans]MCT9006697.1 DUF6193 family natural product biosynthesis protein [Streptomyces rhizosphaerihabitans]
MIPGLLRLSLGGSLNRPDHVGMTHHGQSRQPLQPDSALYPDVAAAGSLAAALAQCAAENGLDLGEVRSSLDRPSLIHAGVASRNPRLDHFNVNLGSEERVFLVAAWGEGVNLTCGSTEDLKALAKAAAAWYEGVPLAELHAAAPFLEVGTLAAAHERGPEHAVAEKWRGYLEPGLSVDLDLIRAAYAEPRLRALFPFTSHGSLQFSRCTGWPFSYDVSKIHPLGGDRYAVQHRGEKFAMVPAYTAQEAVALVVARMPETWGPAVAGTEHELRDRESC